MWADQLQMAIDLWHRGDTATARPLLRTLADTAPPAVAARAAHTLALLELRAGDPEQAEELLEHAATVDDTAASDAAAHALRTLHTHGPDHPDLHPPAPPGPAGEDARAPVRLQPVTAAPDGPGQEPTAQEPTAPPRLRLVRDDPEGAPADATGHEDVAVAAPGATPEGVDGRGDAADARPAPSAAEVAALRESGQAHLDGDELDAAAMAGERAVASGDDAAVADGYRVLGNVAERREDFDEAVRVFRLGADIAEAARLDGADVDLAARLRLALARALRRRDDFAAALVEARQARALAHGTEVVAKADSYLGNIAYETGDLPASLAAFGQVAQLRKGAESSLLNDIIDTAANNVMAIAINAGRTDDAELAARGMALGIEAGVGADAVDVVRQVALGVADNDPVAACWFLREVLGRESAYDQVIHIALAELGGADATGPGAPVTDTEEEIERRRAELFALAEQDGDPESADEDAALLWLMRNQSGTATAGAAGRQLIRAARDVVRDDPPHARRMLELVVQYGDPAEVAVAYDEIGDSYGGDEENRDAAIAAYRKGAEIADPAALLPLRSLLMALPTVGDYDGVTEAAQRAVASGDPETIAMGYWMCGEARLHQGDADGAVALYRQAIDVGYDDLTPLVRFDLAKELREQGQSAEALAELGRVISSPDVENQVRAGFLLGSWTFEDGDLDAAAAAFARIAALDLTDDTPDDLAENIEVGARNLIVVANRAHAEDRHDTAVHALNLLDHAAWTKDAVEVGFLRTEDCIAADDNAAALRYLGFVSSVLPMPNPAMELKLAGLYVSADEVATARTMYERMALDDTPEVRAAAERKLSRLDMIVSERRERRETDETLRAAAATGDPSAQYTLGNRLVNAGAFAEARTILAAVPDDAPGYGRLALTALGRTYKQADPDRARELHLRALDGAGERDAVAVAVARMCLGAIAKSARDWPEALRWYEPVIDSGDPVQGPLAAAHLGELAYWLGDHPEAIRFYGAALELASERQSDLVGEAAYRIGELSHADGDLATAREHLRRAVESGDEGFARDAAALLAKIEDD